MISQSQSKLRAILKEDLDWEESLAAWQGVYADAQYVIGHSEATDEEKQTALKNLADSILGIGSRLFDMEEYGQAAEILESGLQSNAADVRAKIVLGLVYFNLGTQAGRNSDAQNFRQFLATSYHYLKYAEDNVELDEFSSKYKYFSLYNLAVLYRQAVPGVSSIPRDVERSYQCIRQAASLPELPDEAYALLNSELSKYRKGFFGGYTYNG